MQQNQLCVGVIGAGAISQIYLTNMIHKFDNLRVKKIAAAHLSSAQKKAKEFDIEACTLEELLQDPEIDMVVNLTPVGAHYELIKAALMAGKHVYTEKTMTDSFEKSLELVKLAEEKGLYLGCAPDTFMGSAIQTAKKVIEEGKIGKVNSFAVSANRDNELLLSLFSFLRQPGAGVINDYAVYYITALVSLLGPVKRVGGICRTPYPTHINILPQSPDYGKVMDTPNESEAAAILILKNGIMGTVNMTCDSIIQDQHFFAIYGSEGILYLSDPNSFGGEIHYLPKAGSYTEQPMPVIPEPVNEYSDNSRGLGPSDMANAILHERETGDRLPNQACKELALHVQEILEAILKGGEEGAFYDMKTAF